MTDLLVRYGLLLIFSNVLLEQLGLPIPAVPTLVVAGALSAAGQFSAMTIFTVAFIAAMIGDAAWYVAGRRYGHRIMRLLCRMSLSPDSCVRQSEHRFYRWGRLALVLAKFIPGISTITPPLAGAMRLPWTSFVLFDALGSAIWAAAAIGLGIVFHRQIDQLLAVLQELGPIGVVALGALLAGYIAVKWWERRRFYKQLRLARITVDELRRLLDQGEQPLVVDLRSAASRAQDGRSIPGSIAMAYAEVERPSDQLPADREIIFYCSCPNDAGAAYAAKKLIALGHKRVRPLHGGIDAWIAAGYEVEQVSAAAGDGRSASITGALPS